ncbi:RNA polymerase sigma factor [Corynebacterium choanae]|uniref:ECF RNA polymerase sigma factor SigM n=1 Tax=Corynebacterium choanae TaxID=1862358 RepID=A0A3G6J9Z6_9CORY|nr:sigma-70 family RNA polymerase sigma factor [Corynebacterium choanae]AZA14729.1 ECF RNA polymerase sigma factor SigM [Corynebacterium choanae]
MTQHTNTTTSVTRPACSNHPPTTTRTAQGFPVAKRHHASAPKTATGHCRTTTQQPVTHPPTTTPPTPHRPTTTSGSHHHDPDTHLVHRYCEGETSAFRDIVARHEEHLRWVARRYAKCEQDAEDIMQDALFSASRGLAKFRQDAKLSTWLYRIVANAGYDHAHKNWRGEQLILDDDSSGRTLLEVLESTEPTSDQALSITMQAALQKLSQEQREAIVLIDIIGHTVNQVAAYQGVRPGTVKSRRSRAKEILRSELTPIFDD